MSWEADIFGVLDDLEQQAEGLYDAERAMELDDRSRAEYQQVTLAARLMASLDHDVAVEVTGVGTVAGVLTRAANGWVLLTGSGQDWVIPSPAIAALVGASERAVPEVAWSPVARLGLGSALRRLAAAEERCVVHRRDGGRHDGMVRRVGADFVEVAEGAGGTGRISLVSFAAIAAVQSREG